MNDYELEVLNANICMSFDALINKMEDDSNMSIDEICNNIDVLLEVFNGKYSYSEYLEKCNLTNEIFTKLN